MSQNRLFLYDSLIFQALNWLIKPLWIFIIDREVQNFVGTTVYGEYFVHLNFTLLFIMLLDLGIHSFQTRELASNKRFLRVGAGGLLWIKLLLTIFYLVFIIGIGMLNSLSGWWLLAIGINQILASWILYFRTFLASFEKFRWEAIVSVLDRLIAIITCALFLFIPLLRSHFTLSLFVLFQTIALVIALVFVVWLLRKLAVYPRIHKLQSPRAIRLIKANLPYAVLAMIMSLYGRLDVLFIHHYSINGNEMAGIYAQSFRFLEASSMYVMLFTGMLLPLLARMLKQQSAVSNMIHLVIKLAWIPGILLLVFAIHKGTETMEMLYKLSASKAAYSGKVFLFLMWTYLPLSLSLILGALLTAGGKIKALIWSTLLSLIVLVIFSMLYIPTQGAVGAAKAVALTQLSACLFFAILSQLYYTLFKAETVWLFAKLITLGLLLYLIGNQMIELSMWIFGLNLSLLAILLSFGLQLISISQLKKLIKDIK